MRVLNIRSVTSLSLLCRAIGLLFVSSMATASMAAVANSCKLNYPVVLTHHWGMKKICESTPDESCDRLVPEKYCQQWRWDEQGQDKDCLSWRVPDDELDLPPRNYNQFADNLSRDTSEYHRYFSKDVVQRLTQDCGNQVFIADNPAFASSLVRAKALRNTVNFALAETGAEKVVLIGMSQGSQDARQLALLPVADVNTASSADPEPVELMTNKVAAIVSVVGENQGSWSASLFMNLTYAQRHLSLRKNWRWDNFQHNLIWQLGKNKMMPSLWQNENLDYVLSEDDLRPQQEADIYQQFLASNVVLTKKYMTGQAYDWVTWENTWDDLQQAAGLTHNSWSEQVPARQEADNGIEYFSYAAQVRRWNKDWGSSTFLALLVRLLEGKDDGYVTVKSQSFSPAMGDNMQHVKTVSGSQWGSGYHHMYFSGRNDALYGPVSKRQETGLYQGSSADFYQQVMRDLVAAGF
jgi:hypothetical protein